MGGNKKEVINIDASSAAWTVNADLSQLKGKCVVANASGRYTAPKTREGEVEGWVAVVQDGVDLRKVAQSAKAQGASGLIVRCTEAVSLQTLTRAAEGYPPELPTVFVGGSAAATFEERGLILTGAENWIEHLGDAMNSITNATQNYSASSRGEVFENVGKALVELGACTLEGVDEPETEIGMSDTDAKFRWKVASNTHYLWAASGGATKMKVDYGKAAPPSAQRVRVDEEDIEVGSVDASQSHNNVKQIHFKREFHGRDEDQRCAKTKILGLVDADDLQARRLGNDLCEVLTKAEVDQIDREELDVDAGAKEENLGEEEIIDMMAGTIVGTI